MFIQHLFCSSCFVVSVFTNSVNFSITDITNAIENTPIVLQLKCQLGLESDYSKHIDIVTLFRSSTFQYELSVKLSNKHNAQIATSVVTTVRHCRSFGFWLKLANNCEMFNKLPLSDNQNEHHWISEPTSLKAIYNSVHVAPHSGKVCVKNILKLDVTIAARMPVVFKRHSALGRYIGLLYRNGSKL